MVKKIIQKVILLFCFMAFFSVANAAELVIDTEKFGDYKWGYEVNLANHKFLYVAKKSEISYYRFSSEQNTYGEVPITDVRFGIKNNAFFEGILIAEGKSKYDQLVGVLMNRYGKPKLIDGFQVWDVDQLLIAGQYDPNHDSNYAPDNQIGVISIFYLGNFKIPIEFDSEKFGKVLWNSSLEELPYQNQFVFEEGGVRYYELTEKLVEINGVLVSHFLFGYLDRRLYSASFSIDKEKEREKLLSTFKEQFGKPDYEKKSTSFYRIEWKKESPAILATFYDDKKTPSIIAIIGGEKINSKKEEEIEKKSPRKLTDQDWEWIDAWNNLTLKNEDRNWKLISENDDQIFIYTPDVEKAKEKFKQDGVNSIYKVRIKTIEEGTKVVVYGYEVDFITEKIRMYRGISTQDKENITEFKIDSEDRPWLFTRRNQNLQLIYDFLLEEIRFSK